MSLLAPARRWDPGTGGDGADRLARFLAGVIAVHRAHQGIPGAVREAAHDSGVSDFYTADLEGFDEVVRRTLRSRRASGSTAARRDVTAASRVIVWGGSQALTRHLVVDDGSGDAALAREPAAVRWYGTSAAASGHALADVGCVVALVCAAAALFAHLARRSAGR
ncbi:hypothetical protein [Streptomyces sp. NPDC048521]|uniref:hypothetical protein n=1 Tax=Streptomyces sp. NPDC048521 TaxID=3365566 RepID=UPI00371EC72F